MRILTTDQRSERWQAARRGRVTASCIDKVLAKPNTKARRGYIDKLVLDLEGIDDFADDAHWFTLGRKFEPYALGWYQDEKQVDVENTGFILHDQYNWMGASPDGLVGPRGGVEAKFRTSLRTFHDACTKPLTRAYEYQMQACMWVCEKEWWDYLNYWRSVDGKKEQGHIRRLERDDGKIKEIEEAGLVFWRDVVTAHFRQTGKREIVYPFEKWQKEQNDERKP